MTVSSAVSSAVSSGFGVYKAINNVQAALSKTGIQKNQQNQQQRYNFRGIDDIYNALAPRLAEFGLCIMPTVLDREVVEVATRNGGKMNHVTVKIKLDFISSEDGSCKSIEVYGEAMDSSDKATNKAMTAAYKVAAFQVFCIPTEGSDNDADFQTHEIGQNQPQQQPPQQQPQQSSYNHQSHQQNRQPANAKQQYYKDVSDQVKQQYANTAPVATQQSLPVITPVQVKQLNRGLEMASMTNKQFCSMAKINQLGELTQNRFEGAMKAVKNESMRTSH